MSVSADVTAELQACVAAARRVLPPAVLAGEQRLVLAVSGGRDSMVAYTILRRLGVRVAVWHGQHGWRADAQADAAWLARCVAADSVPFLCEHAEENCSCWRKPWF